MCRNIKTLFNFKPAVTEAEIQAASVQFVRKVSGFTKPSVANEVAFDKAVSDITAATQTLLDTLITTAAARDRQIEMAKAQAQSAKRFGR